MYRAAASYADRCRASTRPVVWLVTSVVSVGSAGAAVAMLGIVSGLVVLGERGARTAAGFCGGCLAARREIGTAGHPTVRCRYAVDDPHT